MDQTRVQAIKQKLRHKGPERNATAATEVKQLLKQGFTEECPYSKWLTNVRLVKKLSGAWTICVDFTDLNKTCPKDNHPLINTDRLVDSSARHALLSFMDANAGYHQIPMAEQGRVYAAFVTNQGVYCYRMMPFVL